MKILHLVHNFPPEFFGGTELYVFRLCQELVKKGHQIQVLTGSEKRMTQPGRRKETWEGVAVTRLFRKMEEEQDLIDIYDAKIEKLVLEVLNETLPDIVHLHHWFNLTNNLLCLITAQGIPGVVTLHDLWATCVRFFRQDHQRSFCSKPSDLETCSRCILEEYPLPENETRESLGRRLTVLRKELAAASCLIFPSEAQRSFVSSVVDIEGKAQRVVPHGRLFPFASEGTEKKRPFPDGALGVGHWGHLVESKGTHLIIDAAKMIGPREDVHWHIWGEAIDSGYGERLQQEAVDLPVTFHGSFAPDQIPAFREHLDLVVIPSLCHESYSFVLEEAFSLGLPALVSDRGALPERIGRSGQVFEADNAQALATLVQNILGEPEKLKELRAFPEKPFRVEKNAEAVEALYAEILSANQGGP